MVKKTNVLMTLDIPDHGLIIINKSTLKKKQAWVACNKLAKIWKSKSKKENESKTFHLHVGPLESFILYV